MHYSRLPCAAGLLCAAPQVPSPGQGDHLLLPPVQLSSHPANIKIRTNIQSVHVLTPHTTQSTVHLSV